MCWPEAFILINWATFVGQPFRSQVITARQQTTARRKTPERKIKTKLVIRVPSMSFSNKFGTTFW